MHAVDLHALVHLYKTLQTALSTIMKAIRWAIPLSLICLPACSAFHSHRAPLTVGQNLGYRLQFHSLCTRSWSVHSERTTSAVTDDVMLRPSLPGPVKSLVSFLNTLWDFTRPHTIVGSALSVIALYVFATPSSLWFTMSFASSLMSSLLPALFMNLYITGLNQITDIEIDKVNKPYLPLAAGTLTRSHGIAVVVLSLLASLLLVRPAAWPLQATVIGSGILGTLYSMPPFRLKRFPLLAAFCILVVRGSLVNMGFFLQAKADVMRTQLPSLVEACRLFPESVVLTAFFAVFGIVIALMKDVPDIDGDKKFNIPSFSVKRGASAMFK
jgi:homogentisate phytyltransferase / homogentisate geranylgeranyltransferase